MDRIQKILKHGLFREHLRKNREAEADRIFCRHDLPHFLDVARIGYILDLEEHLEIEKEWIYAAALLHDLGKHLQYEQKIPHEQSGAEIARTILADCGFSEKETGVIVSAIETHRDRDAAAVKDLNGILYRADKLSRACYACDAEKQCRWEDSQKNGTLEI